MPRLPTLAFALLLPANAGAQEAAVDWPALEQRVERLEGTESSCDHPDAAAEANDTVATFYTDLQGPLSHPGTTAEDFTIRLRATVLMRRVARAGSSQLLALEHCCAECSSFSAWQLDAMAQSMERTLLSELDRARTELGAAPAHDLCALLPEDVSKQSATCAANAAGDG